MEKICIFCGKPARAKSSEHVLPQWLIKATGNPSRIASFGPSLKTFKPRQFAYDQLKFPACADCNGHYSALEERAKRIIKTILDGGALSALDMDDLLTWFDKVRVGLWLGYRLLDKNVFGISPSFFINQRISNKDRAILISKTIESTNCLTYIGVNTPFFAHSPTCFGLIINDTNFINISTDYVLSRRMGLPYPIETFFTDPATTVLEARMKPGLERIMDPLFRVDYSSCFTEIYQPIIPAETVHGLSFEMYQTAYVKQFFHDSLKGKVLFKKPHRQIADFPIEETKAWIPEDKLSKIKAHMATAKTVFAFHKYLLSIMPLLDNLKNGDAVRNRRNMFCFIKKTNDLFLKALDKESNRK